MVGHGQLAHVVKQRGRLERAQLRVVVDPEGVRELDGVLLHATDVTVRNLVFGIVLDVIMIYRPEGLIPSARRKRELRQTTDEGMEVGSLDVVPGAPGFESEVRVE